MNRSTQDRQLRLRHILAICLALLAAHSPARADEVPPLVVVTSRDDGPYEGVLAGVKRALANHTRGRDVRVSSLRADPAAAVLGLSMARSNASTPLITIGSAATSAALDVPGPSPVIACMTVDADELRRAPNATGVALEFPLETELEWIRRFVPGSQAVGVLYNPDENEARIQKAHRVADRLGFRLVAREVRRPQDLPDALNSMAREADFLMAVTDQVVFSRQTTQAILLFSFRNRMPFSGLSASWVKAGALYALDRDYEDLGAQCGEMAVEVLNGRPVSSIQPTYPRKVEYAINVRTADQLKLRLPQELVENAAKVFK